MTRRLADAAKKTVRLARGGDMAYERLIVSPGIDFTFGDVQGYEAAMRNGAVLHAWKAGPQTVALRQRLEQMRDGGVYILSIPVAPYRCPPGPYERTSVVASYFKQTKPRSKVLVLDANPDVTSKGGLFKRAWSELYPGIVEYRGNANVVAVEAGAVRTDFDTIKGDVLNVVPPHRAGDIAAKSGLITTNNRWCDVDWRTMESKAVKGVHVLGDATLPGPGMPKSASMANNHAKIAAAAIVQLLNGRQPAPVKILNTCSASSRRRKRSASPRSTNGTARRFRRSRARAASRRRAARRRRLSPGTGPAPSGPTRSPNSSRWSRSRQRRARWRRTPPRPRTAPAPPARRSSARCGREVGS
jgi:sulfite dehydrogenase